MRPIDADALYQTEKLLDTNINRRDKAASELLEQILYDIQHFPTLTPPNDWVSADERLPENYTDVLCWYEYFRHGDYNRMYQTYGIGYCINGQWGGEVSNGTKCKVLYWQPMPAPPDRRPPEGEDI